LRVSTCQSWKICVYDPYSFKIMKLNESDIFGNKICKNKWVIPCWFNYATKNADNSLFGTLKMTSSFLTWNYFWCKRLTTNRTTGFTLFWWRTSLQDWPARFPNLIPLDNFAWGYMLGKMHIVQKEMSSYCERTNWNIWRLTNHWKQPSLIGKDNLR
jgi:hypothetical protein